VGDQGAGPHSISRGMGREVGREAWPAVEEPREGATVVGGGGHGRRVSGGLVARASSGHG
jgi:hypothetical protein